MLTGEYMTGVIKKYDIKLIWPNKLISLTVYSAGTWLGPKPLQHLHRP